LPPPPSSVVVVAESVTDSLVTSRSCLSICTGLASLVVDVERAYIARAYFARIGNNGRETVVV
jgi:hypothetical protein